MEMSLELITALSQLMVEKKLDQIKVGDVLITKTKHETPKVEATSPALNGGLPFTEEELFYSATGFNSLTPEQVDALSTPRKRK